MFSVSFGMSSATRTSGRGLLACGLAYAAFFRRRFLARGLALGRALLGAATFLLVDGSPGAFGRCLFRYAAALVAFLDFRGLAFLATRNPKEAVVEFSRLLAHPGLAAGDPVDAAARLQFARALGLAGDKVKAASAYSDFLASWKNADQDIPIRTQAKAEFAKLQ